MSAGSETLTEPRANVGAGLPTPPPGVTQVSNSTDSASRERWPFWGRRLECQIPFAHPGVPSVAVRFQPSVRFCWLKLVTVRVPVYSHQNPPRQDKGAHSDRGENSEREDALKQPLIMMRVEPSHPNHHREHHQKQADCRGEVGFERSGSAECPECRSHDEWQQEHGE